MNSDKMNKLLYPYAGAREEAWDRISRLAGIDPETEQPLPETEAIGIDRKSCPWWRSKQ